jgi:hypothetical protein
MAVTRGWEKGEMGSCLMGTSAEQKSSGGVQQQCAYIFKD